MGAELECSTDYLLNEAMRQYARSRNWGARSSAVGAQAPAAVVGGRPEPAPAPSRGGVPPMPTGRIPQPTPPHGVPPYPGGAGRPRSPTGPQPIPGRAASAANVTVPPPLPGGGSAPVARGQAEMPPLSVIFNGQKFPVNKEEFVIGRGSKTADLAIKDGNISRRHAAIVLQNGNFYMKDLGSTNGIEFNGERVESRLILEGDVYQLCDYELRFTYQ